MSHHSNCLCFKTQSSCACVFCFSFVLSDENIQHLYHVLSCYVRPSLEIFISESFCRPWCVCVSVVLSYQIAQFFYFSYSPSLILFLFFLLSWWSQIMSHVHKFWLFHFKCNWILSLFSCYVVFHMFSHNTFSVKRNKC